MEGVEDSAETTVSSSQQRRNFWLLCEELTLAQAALLVAGYDPSKIHDRVEICTTESRPLGYEAVKQALIGAIRKNRLVLKRLNGSVVPPSTPPAVDHVSMTDTIVEMDSLREWLLSKGVKKHLLLPEKSKDPEYLKKGQPRYAPKLAAAVRAWEATHDVQGRHPKQALMKWLREHAAEFGLCNGDGMPNENVLEEIAKVANWQLKGGAPETPAVKPSPNKTRDNSSY